MDRGHHPVLHPTMTVTETETAVMVTETGTHVIVANPGTRNLLNHLEAPTEVTAMTTIPNTPTTR